MSLILSGVSTDKLPDKQDSQINYKLFDKWCLEFEHDILKEMYDRAWN